ncbi:glycoside hydrolase family 9 protein [Pleurocapsa sp. PCC 7319]|uniref:glycoside hydrolase family 9 protein n=1 Tax=Pleurocapsa sp. PCC 7319 TaxID=118161 RepID=UPI00034C2211|nr:glycoside hydrolase family 9 protein [Pleurocapsa sp. PCC 7319]
MTLIFIVLTSAHTISQATENYGEALQKSILFFEAQQAGKLPEWNRFPWRGDSTPEDGADVGIDLSGGWIDAGDNVKFNFPMAYSVTTLAWGGIEYYDAYQQSGQLVHLGQNIKWATDYLLNSFVNDTPGNYVLYGQVGNGKKDHKWWGAAEVVHYEMERPAYKIDTSCPGTDLAGETSAAMASSSILFRQNGDLEYADLLVEKAERLFDFANNYRGKYSDCLKAAVPFYTSVSGEQDELVWAAIWLHKAKTAQNRDYSGEYLDLAEAEYLKMSKPFNYTYQFDDKSYGIYVLLAQETGKTEYQKRTEAWLDFWTVGYQGKKITYTPGGLAFLAKWGSLPLAANTSFLSFVYSDWLKTQGEIEKAERYFDFGVDQINYILGHNPSKRSYMIGYGNNYPQNPHHRTAHGSWLNNAHKPSNNRNLLMGALVGGPDNQDNWQDDRNDWVRNEVGVSYNAGFAGALAKMYAEFGGEPLTEISFPQADEPEIYVETQTNISSRKVTEIILTIINKSATPARGLENALVRISYDADPKQADNISVSVMSRDCPYTPAQIVKVEDGVYYTEVGCGGTVIYPGGNRDYKKRIKLKLEQNKSASGNNSLFNSFNGIFGKPLAIAKICLYEENELLWESDSSTEIF